MKIALVGQPVQQFTEEEIRLGIEALGIPLKDIKLLLIPYAGFSGAVEFAVNNLIHCQIVHGAMFRGDDRPDLVVQFPFRVIPLVDTGTMLWAVGWARKNDVPVLMSGERYALYEPPKIYSPLEDDPRWKAFWESLKPGSHYSGNL